MNSERTQPDTVSSGSPKNMRTASGLRVVRISQSASSAASHVQPPGLENAADVPHHGQPSRCCA
ncbi:hypothetical protein D3C71_1784790 [compost metagenome]